MRTLTVLALAAMLALAAPRAARAGAPAGVRAHASDCGSHHRRRRRRHRRRRHHRRRHLEKKPAPAAAATPPPAAANAASTAAAADAGAKTAAAGNGTPLRRSRVMEFDARLVQGQTASSGAVYLFNRAPRRLPPLLKLKQSYLHLIVDPVLGPDYHDKKKGHR